MKAKNVWMAVFVAVLMVGTTVAASAQGPGPGRGGRGPGMGGPCIEGIGPTSQLNLTAEQQAKLDDMRLANLKEVKPLMDKMHAKRGEMKLLWLEKEPDEAKILAAQKEYRALRDEIQDKRTAHHLAMLKVLTPEQQAKLKSFKGGRGMGRDGVCGGGKGRGPGYGPGHDHGGPGYGPRR